MLEISPNNHVDVKESPATGWQLWFKPFDKNIELKIVKRYSFFPPQLNRILDEYLDDYNQINTAQMKLVLFLDAVRHVCRIARIIRQPLGNALLLGVGGSGRQSLTRLAAHMSVLYILHVCLYSSIESNHTALVFLIRVFYNQHGLSQALFFCQINPCEQVHRFRSNNKGYCIILRSLDKP